MKHLLGLGIIGAFLLGNPGTDLVWSKAHVPLNLVQVCNKNGVARNVTPRRSARLLEKGNACRLPACAFNLLDANGNFIQQTIFPPGSDCDNADDNEDGFCDASGTPADVSPARDARGVTQACSVAF